MAQLRDLGDQGRQATCKEGKREVDLCLGQVQDWTEHQYGTQGTWVWYTEEPNSHVFLSVVYSKLVHKDV